MEQFKTEYKNVNSKQIIIDEDYQRMIDFVRVRKIVANFNPNLVNPIKVSFRDGKYYCFDGQHTLSALKAMNGNKDLPVSCKVYYGMEKKDEAELFAEQNGISRTVATAQKMKSLYVAGHIDIIDFKRCVEDCGFKCDFGGGGKSQKRLVCYSSAFKIFKKYGEQQLKEVLRIIMGAWNGEPESVTKEILVGIDLFTRTYKGAYQEAKLIKRLTNVSPVRIKSDGRAIQIGGDKRYASIILDIYNKNTSTGRLEYKF